MTPLPGEFHPALAMYVDAVRALPPETYDFRYVSNPRPSAVSPFMPETEPATYTTHIMRRERAAQSFYPDLGGYVWDVWVDELGRFIAADKFEWVESAAAITAPPFNPVAS
jgi:hypothetical protein